jgi:hypothetical protein
VVLPAQQLLIETSPRVPEIPARTHEPVRCGRGCVAPAPHG